MDATVAFIALCVVAVAVIMFLAIKHTKLLDRLRVKREKAWVGTSWERPEDDEQVDVAHGRGLPVRGLEWGRSEDESERVRGELRRMAEASDPIAELVKAFDPRARNERRC